MKYAIANITSCMKRKEYYIGKKYTVQGCTYYVFNDDIKTAKLYSSKKIAQNAINSIYHWNIMCNLTVIEISE